MWVVQTVETAYFSACTPIEQYHLYMNSKPIPLTVSLIFKYMMFVEHSTGSTDCQLSSKRDFLSLFYLFLCIMRFDQF